MRFADGRRVPERDGGGDGPRSPWDNARTVGDVAYCHGFDTEQLRAEVERLEAKGFRIQGAYIVRHAHGDERHVVLLKPATGEDGERFRKP